MSRLLYSISSQFTLHQPNTISRLVSRTSFVQRARFLSSFVLYTKTETKPVLETLQTWNELQITDSVQEASLYRDNETFRTEWNSVCLLRPHETVHSSNTNLIKYTRTIHYIKHYLYTPSFAIAKFWQWEDTEKLWALKMKLLRQIAGYYSVFEQKLNEGILK
jgi:hypothetical protein